MTDKIDSGQSRVTSENPKPLTVLYVTTCLPVPSEAFACVEVSALARKGVQIIVRSLGPKSPVDPKMLLDYELGHLDRTSGGFFSLPRAMIACVLHPLATMRLFAKALNRNGLSLANWLRNLVIVPRSVEVFHDILNRQPDVVHLFWGHFPSQVAWLLTEYAPGQRWTISLGAYDIRMKYSLTREVLPHAGFIRTLANDTVSTIEQLAVSTERINVIHRGILLRPPRRENDRNLHQILFAGRLIESKGLEELLSVYWLIKRGFPDARLIIAGDGPMRYRLQQRIDAERIADVKLVGHIPQAELGELMLESDVFLFLSHLECLPNAVKEAMASGCHCVVSATDGIDELVPGPEFGWVVPVYDIEAAVKATRAAITHTDPDIRQNAADHIAENFSVDQSADELIQLWRGLVEEDDSSMTS